MVLAPVLLVALLTAGCYMTVEVRFRDPKRVSLFREDGYGLPQGRGPASVVLTTFTKRHPAYELAVSRSKYGIGASGPGSGQTIVDETGRLEVFRHSAEADTVPPSMLNAPEAVFWICWYEHRSRRYVSAGFEACRGEAALRAYLVSPWDNVELITKTFRRHFSDDERVEVVYPPPGSSAR
jgi:hypothetical protein